MKFAGKPLLLMILDGWGMKTGDIGNALSMAKIPNFDRLWQDYPHTTLAASGSCVGLPDGQMGDSEVGHMNIGAGRVVFQDYTRICNAINDGSFFKNEVFLRAIKKAKDAGGAVHFYGLLSDGGVHSHISHLFALLRLAKEQEIEDVFVHCFLDGRDTPPASAIHYVSLLEEEMARLGIGKIADLIGRFYAMDRDKRWDRIGRAYNLMVYGEGEKFSSPIEAIEASYAKDITDEFMEPAVIVDVHKNPLGLIKTGDSVIFFNYRSDRAREISHAFLDNDFDFFDRGEAPPHVNYACLTHYDDMISAPVAYPPAPPVNTLGRVLSRNGLRQLRIAETEKYAHVTFFFNGGVEKMDTGEDRVLIPSPNVPTYDLHPEMSAGEVTRALIDRIESGIYDVIILNFANPDMVGHTGNLHATLQTLNFVDSCVYKLEKVVKEVGGTMLITADHGNVDKMIDEENKPVTCHTTSRVPFILVDDELKHVKLREGELDDIAPTMLQLLGLKQPQEMTGETLITSGLNQYDQMQLFF